MAAKPGGSSHHRASEEGRNICTPKDTINPVIIDQITTQIQRSYVRNRKGRIKLLVKINEYFYKVSEILQSDDSTQRLLIQHIEDLQNMIVETTKLCVSLSEPASKIPEIFETVYDMGAYMEIIVIGAYTWCLNNGKLFGKLMRKFLNELIKISCDNPQTWLYYVVISPMVMHIFNGMLNNEHTDFRIQWAQSVLGDMKQISKAVSNCGDFGCQYYLLTVFHAWAQWMHAGVALPTINSIFSFVEPNARKELLMPQESGTRVRNFLNSFNLAARGPKSVIPILCNYLFVGECKLSSEAEFWVDFSVISGRLHTFYSSPGSPLVSLGIRKDQIHSICLNWVINDGKSQALDSQVEMETQPTPSTFMKDETVLFFHVVLNVDFEEISKDIGSLVGKKYRSMYFVFRNGELVEKIMKEMNYAQHVCGTMDCQRPRTLRRMLASQKLSYSQSWCPDSQVFGLDKSPLDRSTRSFLNQTDPDSPFATIQRFYSPHSSFRSFTPSSFLLADLSSAEDTQSQTKDGKENQTVSLNISNFSFRLDDLSSAEGTQSETRDRNGKENQPVSLNMSNFSFAASLLETSRDFLVSVTSPEEYVISEDEVNTSEGRKLNSTAATNETFYEDPLPPMARGKYGNLCKHVPFQTKSPLNTSTTRRALPTKMVNLLESRKSPSKPIDVEHHTAKGGSPPQPPQSDLRLRCSSPNPEACNQMRSPAISEISKFSPRINICNTTVISVDQNCSMEIDDRDDGNQHLGGSTNVRSPKPKTLINEEEPSVTNETPLPSFMKHNSSSNAEDQEYEDSRLPKMPVSAANGLPNRDSESKAVPQSPLRNSFVEENSGRSSPLSPVVGYSRILLRKSELSGERTSTQTSDSVRNNKPIANNQNSPASISALDLRIDTSLMHNDSCSTSAKLGLLKSPLSLNANESGEVQWTPSPLSKSFEDHNSTSEMGDKNYRTKFCQMSTRFQRVKSPLPVCEEGDTNDIQWTPTPTPSSQSSTEENSFPESNANHENESSEPPAKVQNIDTSLPGEEPDDVIWTPTQSQSSRGSIQYNAPSSVEGNDNQERVSHKRSTKLRSIPFHLTISENESNEVIWTPTQSPRGSAAQSLPSSSNRENRKHENEFMKTPVKIVKMTFPFPVHQNEPSVIPESPPQNSMQVEMGNWTRSAERSPSLSPIVGYSKPLFRRSQLSPDQTLTTQPNMCRESPSKKLPCYAYANKLRETSLIEKRRKSDYDPYDIWTSSEMEEFKKKIFPELKTKTYARRKKPAWEHRIIAKKRKKSKPESPPKRKTTVVEVQLRELETIIEEAVAGGKVNENRKTASKKAAKKGFLRPLKLKRISMQKGRG